jgi:hypothetical protein
VSTSDLRYRDRSSTLSPNDLGYYCYTTYDNWGRAINETYRSWPEFYEFLTESDDCYDQLHPGPPYKTGGPFDKTSFSLSPLEFGEFTASVDSYCPTVYKGVFRPFSSLCNIASTFQRPDNFGFGWGDGSKFSAAAYNKARPGRPGVDLALIVGELRDLPQLFKMGFKSFKDLGGNYLNYQFGWAPMVSDFKKFLRTTETLANRLAWLKRNNGRIVRSSCELHDTRTEGESGTVGSFVGPLLHSTLHSGLTPFADGTWEVVDTQRVWFEGNWQYHIKDIDSPETIRRLTRKLYGLQLTPSLLYNLTPWTWLADWFVNLGDIVSNLDGTAADNLSSTSAYLMCHTKRVVKYQCHGYRYYANTTNWPLNSVSAVLDATFERKQRMRAVPFKFDLTFDSFSMRQLRILSALGLSRQRRF